MFFDSSAWPPAPDGAEPTPPPPPRLTPAGERTIMGLIGFWLLAMVLGPLAGSSVVAAIIALVRSIG